jgi:hypothetical protein
MWFDDGLISLRCTHFGNVLLDPEHIAYIGWEKDDESNIYNFG